MDFLTKVSAGVYQSERVVEHVGVPVVGLGIGRIGDQDVGADEPAELITYINHPFPTRRGDNGLLRVEWFISLYQSTL